MNERIEKLIEQCTAQEFSDCTGGFETFDKAKFAELIVRECVRICINEGKTYEIESAGEYSSNLYATAIKKHFGVEE